MTSQENSGFEIFRHRIAPASMQPSITIQKRGILSLSAEAHQLLGTPSWVELMYDAARRVIGIRQTSIHTPHAYPLRDVGAGAGAQGPMVISATAFLRFFDIEIDRTRRWTARLDEGVLTIDLTQAGVAVTSNRAPSRSRRNGGESPFERVPEA